MSELGAKLAAQVAACADVDPPERVTGEPGIWALRLNLERAQELARGWRDEGYKVHLTTAVVEAMGFKRKLYAVVVTGGPEKKATPG